jgi:hypothetical protein
MTVSAPIRSLGLFVALVGAITPMAAGCRKQEPPAPPVASPSIRINHDKAPLGSPIEITYKFVVQDTGAIDQDYRVMVHVVDTDEELMWTDDHNPPVPTTAWKQGQQIEYTRTVFVPIYPYIGDASIEVGLYSTTNQKRLPLAGEDVGKRAYRVGRVQLTPQTENVFTVFKDGWHPAEVAEHNASVEWQWTKKQATLLFKNPKKDSLFYLDLDNTMLNEPQQVQVSLGGQAVDRFSLGPKKEMLRKIPLPAARLGSVDMAELEVSVDKTFVPALLDPNSKDPRELGVRVFHAFVDAR